MQDQAKVVERWRYLRGLLLEQLEGFETGRLQIHSNAVDVSPAAIAKLKRGIAEFDELLVGDSPSDA